MGCAMSLRFLCEWGLGGNGATIIMPVEFKTIAKEMTRSIVEYIQRMVWSLDRSGVRRPWMKWGKALGVAGKFPISKLLPSRPATSWC